MGTHNKRFISYKEGVVMSQSTSCISSGSTSLSGYKQVPHNGKMVYLHKLVYAKSKGLDVEKIATLKLTHSCKNKRCINPEHIIPVDKLTVRKKGWNDN